MKAFIYLEREKEQAWVNLAVLAVLSLMVIIGSSSYLSDKSLFSFLESSNSYFLKQLIPFCLGLLVLLIGNKILVKRPVIQVFTANSIFSWKKCWLSFTIWMGLLAVLLFIQWISTPQMFEFQFQLKPFFELLVISLVFVSIQTIYEELLFRSFVLQAFGSMIRNKAAVIVVVSILFTAMHMANPEISILGREILVFYFLTSLFLTILVVLDQGIELSIGFHAANNLFGSLILTNNWQVFQTKALFIDNSPPKISWDIWIILLFLYPVLTFIYLKVTKTNFGSIFDNNTP